MKTIGLIGGMSWESSSEYYRIINEEVKNRLGGLHSAKCVLYSVDFEEIEICQRNGEWGKAAQILANAARSLEKAGADFIVICTNTMHKVADDIQAGISIPLLHIADITAEQVLLNGIKTVGLLGTRYTMEQDFYKSRLENQSIKVLIPKETDREIVNTVIYRELCLGQIIDSSRVSYKRIIEDLIKQGAEGIILGCTEIGLLVKSEDSTVPLYDTTLIHAIGAVNFSLINLGILSGAK
ncbi:aspartate/glutamate racemase family protein [Desulfosporosinus nitroreducens]|uniref:Aspartate/glutamate racemase family protein n=1 Tax=Desulfosporosinus nitroreducens TaxID=2018668 RepID=A0ABT8QS06_9FIRM|nr:aspartate/glutamate racemase family protein [Desulfosporosinus nitroreducens]MCO1602536.1 aspartate/glutamate racemase family protein [Desulfosporosinus nitroreducens]MDO0824128.1 aspartate/glutamate racemase family protein [Desulfosporosinus nitroreducens]